MKHKLHFAVRVVCCMLLLALAYIVQSSLGVRISIFSVHIDVLPIIIAAVGIVMGSGAGLACGLFAGLLYDVAGTGAEGLYPLYYLICGIACGQLGINRFRNHPLLGTMLGVAGMIAALAAIRYLFSFQFGDMNTWLLIIRTGLQIVLALILSPIVLRIVRAISGQNKRAAIAVEQLTEGDSDGSS
jgi:rod shape-determining protein MreD